MNWGVADVLGGIIVWLIIMFIWIRNSMIRERHRGEIYILQQEIGELKKEIKEKTGKNKEMKQQLEKVKKQHNQENRYISKKNLVLSEQISHLHETAYRLIVKALEKGEEAHGHNFDDEFYKEIYSELDAAAQVDIFDDDDDD